MKLLELIDLIKLKEDGDWDFHKANEEVILAEITSIDASSNFDDILPKFELADFYPTILRLRSLNYKDEQSKFFGKLWAKFYQTLDSEQQKDFLGKIPDEKDNNWSMIRTLESFFELIEPINATFAAEWFIKLTDYVKADMCNGVFFGALRTYVKMHPRASFETLDVYLNMEFNNEATDILTPYMLGCLRAFAPNLIEDLDRHLMATNSTKSLKTYYSSFSHMYFIKDADIAEVEELLCEILETKNIELQEVAFRLALDLYTAKRADVNLADFITQWFVENSSSDLTQNSKFCCSTFVERYLHNKQQSADIEFANIKAIIANVRSVEQDKRGIWDTLNHILVELLKYDEFEEILKIIIQANGNNFIEALKHFSWFKSEFIKSTNVNLLTRLLFSRNEFERAFARKFYIDESHAIFELEEDVIRNVPEKEFELTCKEIIFDNFSGRIFGKFFSAINSKLDDITDDTFRLFLAREIFYQCINYPQDCFSILENIENKSKLMTELVERVNARKEITSRHENSPVNSFAFAGSFEASVKGHSKFTREIQDASHSQSIFAQICKTIQILYGDKFGYLHEDGSLEERDMTKFSSSNELPMITFANPCESHLKRFVLMREIRELKRSMANDE